MSIRDEQDARHQAVVRAYYETNDSTLLGPMLTELCTRLEKFLCYKGLRDKDLLNDLVQDTMIAVLTDLRHHKYAGTGSVASWVNQIGWHLYCQYLRRKTNHITQPGVRDNPFFGLSLLETMDELPATEDEDCAKALVIAATEFVLRLDADIRIPLALYCFRAMPVAEAAQQLGITSHQFRARVGQGMALLANWGNTQAMPTGGTWSAVRHLDTGPLFQKPAMPSDN
ncbi:RNA polymerase sigma factor [Hymenobacter ruricola]|uniref:Sigma-70 family RNA polymerase sigma factor n=1 Tax=Hymenobacter ruricola TaxID=2791023 RepID=A0ABS0I7J5_9BACT|nr:sigma-70 family RNA polymerase sigma factor [Hymenobacter ruricola]MBF9222527.1 sigma-70 family RNA polymerase sigma factor [Hymenobacter ruricola]